MTQRSFSTTGLSSMDKKSEDGYEKLAKRKRAQKIEDCESFEEFYPLYLGEHRNRTNRRLHFIGSTFALMLLSIFIVTLEPKYFFFALIMGYGFAWVGHFFFEKNKPASFKKPLYSFMGDWNMYKDILTNRIHF